MFLFGKKKAAQNKLIKFLDDADDALMLAYSQRDIRAVTPFLTNSLLEYVGEEIMSGRDMTAELGLPKYRLRTWEESHKDGSTVIVRKKLRHKDVHIHGLIDIPVGDNVDEDWYVMEDKGDFKVTEIRRIG